MKVIVESFDQCRHTNHMHEYPASQPKHVVVLSVGGYRLEFWSLEQLEAASAYFRRPDGSTRSDNRGGFHWEFQPWHCRLPAGITSGRHRSRLLQGLERARHVASSELGWGRV